MRKSGGKKVNRILRNAFCVVLLVAVFVHPTVARANDVPVSTTEVSLSGWVSDVIPTTSTSAVLDGMTTDCKTYVDRLGRHFWLTTMHMPNGDDVYFARYESKSVTRDDPTIHITVTGNYTGSFAVSNPKKHNIAPQMSIKSPTVVDYAGSSLYLRPTERYRTMGHTMLDWDPSGNIPVSIAYASGISTYTIDMKASTGTFASAWFVISRTQKLIDLNDAVQERSSQLFSLDSYQRLFPDGCYERSAATYLPFAAYGYWRNPASIPGNWIVSTQRGLQTSCRLGVDIVYVIASGLMSTQNKDGSWRTGPTSTWLRREYSISFDYFDDRRATDGALFLARFAVLFQQQKVLEAVSRYDAWLTAYAKSYGLQLNNGGILLPDYSSCDENTVFYTHTALNHQLANINYCLETGSAPAVLSKLDLGRRLLLALDATANLWVLPDHNLVYALTRQLTHSPYADYISLTLDDLNQTQNLCTSLSIKTPSIAGLITEKNAWIETSYLPH